MDSVVLLHSAGFSHTDLKKIAEGTLSFDAIIHEFDNGKGVVFPWISPERAQKIREKYKNLDKEKLQRTIENKMITVIKINDSQYPEKLRNIGQAPYLLYVRGVLKEERKMIGVVGSRKNTHYGEKVLESIIPELVQAGCGIVSGGAYGIDTLSHSITLANNGYTISVFGCGVDISYPARNTVLFASIEKSGGALVSSFPIGTRAEPWMFPVRNEIVAALSDGIIIPEAGIKSGTLITAKLALEHGRDVFSVPGDIFHETSQGTNMLIANGEAKCVRNASDVLEEYFQNIPKEYQSEEKKIFSSPEEENVYTAISEGYTLVDGICLSTGYAIDAVVVILSLLEIEGHIRLSSSQHYEIL